MVTNPDGPSDPEDSHDEGPPVDVVEADEGRLR